MGRGLQSNQLCVCVETLEGLGNQMVARVTAPYAIEQKTVNIKTEAGPGYSGQRQRKQCVEYAQNKGLGRGRENCVSNCARLRSYIISKESQRKSENE